MLRLGSALAAALVIGTVFTLPAAFAEGGICPGETAGLQPTGDPAPVHPLVDRTAGTVVDAAESVRTMCTSDALTGCNGKLGAVACTDGANEKSGSGDCDGFASAERTTSSTFFVGKRLVLPEQNGAAVLRSACAPDERATDVVASTNYATAGVFVRSTPSSCRADVVVVTANAQFMPTTNCRVLGVNALELPLLPALL